MAIDHPTPTLDPPASSRAHTSAPMRAENFHVLSRFVPPALREDFAAVYAFCRAADDIADNHPGTEESRAAALDELTRWRTLLDEAAAYARDERNAPPDHPVFAPLAGAMRRRALDPRHFYDLLDAFEQDQRITRYETWEQLLDYCARSANPVGRIVLALLKPPPSPSGRGRLGAARPGEETPSEPPPTRGRGQGAGPTDQEYAHLLSDSVCTGLQLANFLQDVRRDLLERDRVYLPRAEPGLDAETLRRWAHTPDDPGARVAYIRALRPLVERTRECFTHARSLPALMPDRDAARVVRLFLLAGGRLLAKIERAGCITLWERPTLSRLDRAGMLLAVSTEPGPRASRPNSSPALDQALRACAHSTRREARNFYYGMRLTPRPARDALYAVYAWMRAADDDADGHDSGEAPTPSVALARLARRRADLEALAKHGELRSAHPAWIGLAWAIREFPIDPADLAGLLDGLEEDANHDGYGTRAALRAYCERVASTVGRVCVAIWGTRPDADDAIVREKATARGVAFQLVNILRDVGRDHAAGRIYVPREDLGRFGLSAEDLAHWRRPDEASALVLDLCAWARHEFALSKGLETIITPSGAAAMRAMTGVYAALLAKIERDPSLVVREPRASLSLTTKTRIMLASQLVARTSGPG